jgi:adenylate cyclase
MGKDRLSRKLAVILHADVVGSTVLVQKNETLAHQSIQFVFGRLAETVTAYGGIAREVRGDALVAEFDRASDAVAAALGFQQCNEELDSSPAEEIRPQLRIGISLGEVIIADNTITGAGVVLAQRLEQLCNPGGVVVQGAVAETVPVRLPFDFESLGEQTIKGFEQPVRVFAAILRANSELPPPETKPVREQEPTENTQPPSSLSAESYELLIGERFELPDKPSIAVLPFLSMSADREQEIFADGMTEDIITSLSRIPELVVISRNSTFVYKGRAIDVRQIGSELAVSHVLEGSIRKAGDRLRITVQLVETRGGEHIWVDRYDRNLDDIFVIQDEITRNVVVELAVKLVDGEIARAIAVGTESIEAWELIRRAGIILSARARFDSEAAKRLIKRALELDENFAAAWTTLGWVYWLESSRSWSADPEHSMRKAFEAGQRAISSDPNYHMAHSLLGHVYMSRGDPEKAIEMGEKALALAPSDSYAMALQADRLIESGRVEEGIRRMKKAIRLCPFPPAWFLFILGIGFHLKGDNETAIHAFEQSLERDPESHLTQVWLSSALVELGKLEAARSAAEKVLEIEPLFSVEEWSKAFDSRAYSLVKANLLQAGLPK